MQVKPSVHAASLLDADGAGRGTVHETSTTVPGLHLQLDIRVPGMHGRTKEGIPVLQHTDEWLGGGGEGGLHHTSAKPGPGTSLIVHDTRNLLAEDSGVKYLFQEPREGYVAILVNCWKQFRRQST